MVETIIENLYEFIARQGRKYSFAGFTVNEIRADVQLLKNVAFLDKFAESVDAIIRDLIVSDIQIFQMFAITYVSEQRLQRDNF
jgi:hypothetical protein